MCGKRNIVTARRLREWESAVGRYRATYNASTSGSNRPHNHSDRLSLNQKMADITSAIPPRDSIAVGTPPPNPKTPFSLQGPLSSEPGVARLKLPPHSVGSTPSERTPRDSVINATNTSTLCRTSTCPNETWTAGQTTLRLQNLLSLAFPRPPEPRYCILDHHGNARDNTAFKQTGYFCWSIT